MYTAHEASNENLIVSAYPSTANYRNTEHKHGQEGNTSPYIDKDLYRLGTSAIGGSSVQGLSSVIRFDDIGIGSYHCHSTSMQHNTVFAAISISISIYQY